MSAEDFLRVGCSFCGASSHEPCVSQRTALDMPIPHASRVRFARTLPTTRTPEESSDE